jgi:peptide/nickel transport system substrate-binding protein
MSNRMNGADNAMSIFDVNGKFSRRRVLQLMGALGVGVVATPLLSACEDDDTDDATDDDVIEDDDDDVAAVDDDTDDTDDTEVVDDTDDEDPDDDDDDDEPADTDGHRGGTYVSYIPQDTPSLDFHADSGQSQTEWSAHTHSRLFMMASGPDVPSGSIDTQPDAAESIDIAEDGLTYTVALKDNVMFHPPLDRAMTSEDVVYTFNYLKGEELVYGIEDEAEVPDSNRFNRLDVVDSIEAPDDLTVEFTLAAPHPFFQSILADPKVFFIHPVEVRDEIDPTQEAIGSGPWVMEEYSPGTFTRFRRHDDWHLGPEIPYYDEVEVNVVPEYATQLNQFMSGDLDWIVVEPADLPRIQDAVPDAQIYEMPAHPLTVLNFSARDEHWQDLRMRHAVSMCMNRDEMLDAAYGLSQLEQELGEEIPRNWHTNIPVGFSEYWLDPKTEMSEEAAQFMRYDPDRARELVEEAGYSGIQVDFNYSSGRYGEPYRIMSELMIGYLTDIGFDVTGYDLDYNAEFLGVDNVSGGNYNGLMWIQQTRVEPFAYFQTQYLSEGHGMYGQWFGDEDLAPLLDEMRATTDPDELIERVKNFQEVLIRDKMFVVPMQEGAVPSYRVYQPWVENALDYQSFAEGDAAENIPHYWDNRL